ncbi:FHA domain-containing protein [Alloscardovia venturai]|uniref:FHA domain-containing protein n=1 Tax=Alloscardovia venturai TaxID=1769421 RepID=A0ABW2Y2Y5_9BIFI
MTDLTFAILKYGLLAALWIFVWLAVRAINRDVEALAPRKSHRARARRERENHMVVIGDAAPVHSVNSTASSATHPAASSHISHAQAQTAGSNASVNGHVPAILTIIDGPLSGTTMQLGTGAISLGRAANNNLVLDDEFVSSHHARVFLDAASGQWAVEDLGSTNGTKVAGQPIHGACFLPAGVPVRIGATTFELR